MSLGKTVNHKPVTSGGEGCVCVCVFMHTHSISIHFMEKILYVCMFFYLTMPSGLVPLILQSDVSVRKI